MKFAGPLLGFIVVFVWSTGAQATQGDRSLLAWSASPSPAYAISPATVAPWNLWSAPAGFGFNLALPVAPALPSAEPGAAPQEPQGVFPNDDGRAYIGYAFDRFYAFRNATLSRTTIVDTNGFDGSVAYYYHGGRFGAEGELVATFGSYEGQTSSLVTGMGGPRIRWSRANGTELWAHVLVGGAHFSPQTTYGSEGAFAYEAGGGIDIDAHSRRIAYRIECDMVGTRLFGTGQYSPKVSAGVVFKF